MTTHKMSITEALNELKVLDKRIEKAVSDVSSNRTPFVVCYASNAPVNFEEMETKVKAAYESIQDLIGYRNAIKRAVTLSNAKTAVVIDGKEMTVAEAIDVKSVMLPHYHRLLDRMISDARQAMNSHKKISDDVRASALRIIEAMNKGAASAVTENGTTENAVFNDYVEKNQPKMINPIKIEDEIDRLSDFITEFETRIDTTLAVCNAQTQIEFTTEK